ncbi:hypothetical protein DFH07DRAFT_695673, partial [Mycena maculata]
EEHAALRVQWVRFVFLLHLQWNHCTQRKPGIHARDFVQPVEGRNPIVPLVGNKCDRASKRVVSTEEGAVLEKEFGC